MLWTDQAFITPADLLTLDEEIQDNADALTIDLPTAIQRGVEDAGRYLEGNLVSFSTYISSNDLSANHLAAVFYTGSQPNQRRRVTIDQMVVTGRSLNYWSELKTWAANRCLAFFYTQASNKAQDDRYTNKRDWYRMYDRDNMWPMLRKAGIGIVYRPMPTPAPSFARTPENWILSQQAHGGAVATGSYDVALTWVDQSKYLNQNQNGNLESDPSIIKSITLTSGNVISIDITGLNPPNGAVPTDKLARGFTVLATASGWNVWVAPHSSPLILQNATPIPVATKTYALAGDPLTTGFAVGLGQYAEAFLTIPQLVSRA